MLIREARTADLDTWLSLRQALWPDHGLESLGREAQAILDSPDQACFVAIDDASRVVGFIEGAIHRGPEGPYAHVEGWYVVPEFRRQGCGGELLGNLEQWCLHRTICRLTSDTGEAWPISPPAHVACGFSVLARQTIFLKELRPDADRPRP